MTPSQQAHEPRAVAQRFASFGASIFAEMTRLAVHHGAVNLAQGFPDFDGPDFIRDAAIQAMREGHNQYCQLAGIPPLTHALAESWTTRTGQHRDPSTEVTVTAGCTEALAATFLGLINPGDEVILFDPSYDSYPAYAQMAGAAVRWVPLRPPAPGAPDDAPFTFDEGDLRRAFTDRTRAILINTPHNPTGKVFSRDELTLIASLCAKHNAIAITDEVYERLTFDPSLPHISPATIPGLEDRTVTLSSLGKTFSYTGWKIGWAIAPRRLTEGLRAAHQHLIFCVATPFQHAAAAAIRAAEEYQPTLTAEYRERRDFLRAALQRLGFRVFATPGTYFVYADHSPFGFADDVAFCRHLTENVKVAALPPSVLYHDKAEGLRMARFAFCKRMPTLQEGVRRLEAGLRAKA